MTSRIFIVGRTLTVRSAAVAPPSPTQLAWRGRIEAVLRIAAPALDLLLAAGDRLSRVVERDELDPAPAGRASFEQREQRAVGPGKTAE
jgi:hypothetical protein